MQDYGRAIVLNPQFAVAFYNRGNLKANQLQDFAGALVDYDLAIERLRELGIDEKG